MTPGADGAASRRWAAELEGWRIPDAILAQAPEPPWGFPVSVFAVDEMPDGDGPTLRRAREALPPGGVVLDVGVGGGAASLPLAPPASVVVGVDPGEELLASFAASADRHGIVHREVHGRWPEVEQEAPVADVVVCANVLYNVPDLAPFARALTAHARRRVVVELTDRHPLAWMAPLWRHFHGLDRPDGPEVGDAVTALAEADIEVSSEDAPRRHRRQPPRHEWVALVRRRLCLSSEHDVEIDRMIGRPEDRLVGRSVTLWWDGGADA